MRQMIKERTTLVMPTLHLRTLCQGTKFANSFGVGINDAALAADEVRMIRLCVLEDCKCVFAGEDEGNLLQDIKPFWEDVGMKADLLNVRINDLRHTFASLLVFGGMTLPVIGKLLCHTQCQTTQRNAHLLDNLLRAGLEQIGQMLRTKPRLVQNGSS
jgi:hypothetical protein